MKESKSNHCRSRSVPSSTPSSAGPCAIGAWCCTGSYGAFPICKLGTVLQQSGTILPCRAWSLGSLELGQWETWEHWRWLENSFILEFLFKSQSRRARDSCWWKRCFMLRVWPTCNRFFLAPFRTNFVQPHRVWTVKRCCGHGEEAGDRPSFGTKDRFQCPRGESVFYFSSQLTNGRMSQWYLSSIKKVLCFGPRTFFVSWSRLYVRAWRRSHRFLSTSPNQILAFQVLNDMSYGDIHPVFPWWSSEMSWPSQQSGGNT